MEVYVLPLLRFESLTIVVTRLSLDKRHGPLPAKVSPDCLRVFKYFNYIIIELGDPLGLMMRMIILTSQLCDLPVTLSDSLRVFVLSNILLLLAVW